MCSLCVAYSFYFGLVIGETNHLWHSSPPSQRCLWYNLQLNWAVKISKLEQAGKSGDEKLLHLQVYVVRVEKKEEQVHSICDRWDHVMCRKGEGRRERMKKWKNESVQCLVRCFCWCIYVYLCVCVCVCLPFFLLLRLYLLSGWTTRDSLDEEKGREWRRDTGRGREWTEFSINWARWTCIHGGIEKLKECWRSK